MRLRFTETAAVLATVAVVCAPTLSVSQESPAPRGLTTRLMDSGGLLIALGDRVTVGLDDKLRMRVLSVEPAKSVTEQIGKGASGDEARPAPDQLVFNLTQQPSSTVLQVRSGAKTRLRYRALMVVLVEGKLRAVPTSTCPLQPGIGMFESWPHPLAGVVVQAIEETSANDLTCR